MNRVISELAALDRGAGDRLRRATAAAPRGPAAAQAIAGVMGPLFVVAAGAMAATPSRRGTGALMILAGGIASLAALLLRDRLGRARPGPRPEGGMPSRHGAAAAAISTALSASAHPLAGPAWAATAIGGGARVASGDHEPADIVAGAALGAAVGGALSFIVGGLVGWRR